MYKTSLIWDKVEADKSLLKSNSKVEKDLLLEKGMSLCI